MHFLNSLAYILLSLWIPIRLASDCGVPHLEAMCLLISALVRAVSFPIPQGGTQKAHLYRLLITRVSLVRYLSLTDFNSLIFCLYFLDIFCCFWFSFIFLVCDQLVTSESRSEKFPIENHPSEWWSYPVKDNPAILIFWLEEINHF